MIRRPPRSTLDRSSAASDVYKRQVFTLSGNYTCVDVYSLQENMMTQLYRTQVLLERRQHESLQQLAAAEGRSMSEVIREAVAEYLVDHSKERKKQQALDALSLIHISEPTRPY